MTDKLICPDCKEIAAKRIWFLYSDSESHPDVMRAVAHCVTTIRALPEKESETPYQITGENNDYQRNAAPGNGGTDAAPEMPGMVRRWSFAGESGRWISEKDHEGVMTNYERLFKEVDTLRRENAQLRKRYDGDSKALIEALDRAESLQRRVAELEKPRHVWAPVEPKWVRHMRIATLDKIVPHESEYLAYVDSLIACVRAEHERAERLAGEYEERIKRLWKMINAEQAAAESAERRVAELEKPGSEK